MNVGVVDKIRYPVVLTQLAFLITKLDVLTGTPPSVTLTDEQKKVVAEQLAGLDTMDMLTTSAAQTRLDALLAVLADSRPALEAVGFQWPGPSAKRPPNPINPFADEVNAKALKSLQERVGAAAPKQ